MRVGRPTQRNRLRRCGFALVAAIVVVGPQLAALGAFDRFLERSAGGRAAGLFPWAVGAVLVLNLALLLEFARVYRHRELPRWLRLSLFYPYYIWWFGSAAFAIFGGLAQLVTLPFVLAGAMDPLQGTLEAALAATAYLLGAWGVFAGAVGLRPESIDVPIANLPRGWDGARIVQVSDIHAGRYVGDGRVRAMAEAAAAEEPDLVVLTGDLVDHSASFAADAAAALAKIPAKLGIYAVLGNHDYYGGADEVANALTAAGIRLLRNDGVVLERGGDRVYLAGVDEAWFHRTDLRRALAARPDGMTTVLLSHHPELFPEAASRGVALQLSGHTHGGQIGLLRVHPSLSLYRLISPFVAGLYRLGGALLYVNRGVGTVQPLVRLGAPAEVAVLTMRRGDPAHADALEYEPARDDEDAPTVAEPA